MAADNPTFLDAVCFVQDATERFCDRVTRRGWQWDDSEGFGVIALQQTPGRPGSFTFTLRRIDDRSRDAVAVLATSAWAQRWGWPVRWLDETAESRPGLVAV